MFRGGAYKPRSSPYSFQGLGQEGLQLLAEAKAQTGLPIVTELMDARDVEPILEVADVIQVGARNMQNYPLLAEIGRTGKPVLIKRGLSSTLEELLMAAEYVLKEGNPNVMLCERGIRTFETAYRFTLDIMAIPMLKELSHLPVIVDPSHAPGRRDMVLPLSLAAAAAGADGIIVEVHPNPEEAICDGPQQIYADAFAGLPRAGRARGGGGRQGPERRRVKVAVVGVGLIGGSIGLAARQRLGAHVSGYDPSAAAREAAIARGAILEACDSIAGGGRGRRLRLRRRAGARCWRRSWARCSAAAGPDCVVTDVGSVKRAVVGAIDDPRFIGGHPLAGAETAGVEHARADLFQDATWYLTPTPATRGHRLRAPAPAASRGSAPGRRRSTPRPTTS